MVDSYVPSTLHAYRWSISTTTYRRDVRPSLERPDDAIRTAFDFALQTDPPNYPLVLVYARNLAQRDAGGNWMIPNAQRLNFHELYVDADPDVLLHNHRGTLENFIRAHTNRHDQVALLITLEQERRRLRDHRISRIQDLTK